MNHRVGGRRKQSPASYCCRWKSYDTALIEKVSQQGNIWLKDRHCLYYTQK